MIQVFFGVPESYGNSPGSIWALLGHTGIEERGQKEGGLRPPSGPNWTRGAANFSLFLSPSFLLSYSYYLEGLLVLLGKGNPTPDGSRTPLGRAIERAAPPPPPLLYIRGQGGTPETTIDRLIF